MDVREFLRNEIARPRNTNAVRAALLAVVDRHQMVEWPGVRIPSLRARQICGECSDEEFVDYPCPTVQDVIDRVRSVRC